MGFENRPSFDNVNSPAVELPAAALNLARLRQQRAFEASEIEDCIGIDRDTVEIRTRKIIHDRRDRAALFPGQLFANPAWEILLALTLAHARQHRLSITNLCDCVDVPSTTVLRWITALAEDGLVVRRDDATDRRRKYVELSTKAWVKMGTYVSAVILPQPLAA